MSTWTWGLGLAALGMLAGAGPSASAVAQTWKVSPYYPPPWADADLVPDACLVARNDTANLPDRAEWEALLAELGADLGPYGDRGVPVTTAICASSTDLFGPVVMPDCTADCQEVSGNPEDPPCTSDCWESRCEIRFAKATDPGPFLKRLSNDETVCPLGEQPPGADLAGCWGPWSAWDGLLGRSKYVEDCRAWAAVPQVPPPEMACMTFGLSAGNDDPAFVLTLCPAGVRAIVECLRGAGN